MPPPAKCGARIEPWRARPVPFWRHGFAPPPRTLPRVFVDAVPWRRALSSARTHSCTSGPLKRAPNATSSSVTIAEPPRTETLLAIGAHLHHAVARPGGRAANHEQVAPGVDAHDLKAALRDALVAHLAGAANALEDAGGIGGGADRARGAHVVRAVGDRPAREVVALDRALEALALRDAGDLDPLARLEGLDGHGLADLQLAGLVAELDDVLHRRRVGLAQVAELGLGEVLLAGRAERELDGLVAVAVERADPGHGTRPGLEDGDALHAPVFEEQLRHPELLGEDRGHGQSLAGEADLDVDAGREVVEALERVDRLRRRLVDVDEPLVRADLEVLARVLVLERGSDHAVDVLLRGQRHRAGDRRARAGRGLDDLLRRRLDGRVVVGLQPDADLVLGGGCHSVCLSSVFCRWKLRTASLRAKGGPQALRGPPRPPLRSERRGGCGRVPLPPPPPRGGGGALRSYPTALLDDLGDDARADRPAALAVREAQALVHGDRLDELDLHLDVVAGHDHLDALGQVRAARHVGRPEVELRAVAREERRVAAALLLLEDVDLGLELRVRRDRLRLAEDLAALDVLALGAAQLAADVVAGLALVEDLAEHLDAGHDRGRGVLDADDLDGVARVDDALLDAARRDGAAAGDREDVLDRHQERLVEGALRLGDVGVEVIGELVDRLLVLLVTLERLERGALDERDVVAREVVLGEQVADLDLDELEELLVVDHVDLVQEHDDVRHADLAGEQDVLARLRHRAVSGRHDQDRAVHLGGARDHVLDVVRVTRAVDVRVVAVRRLVLDVRRVDRDAALLLLRRLVDLVEVGGGRAGAGLGQHLGDGCGQRRLAMVDVTDGADVEVRLVPLELLLGHLAPVSFALALALGELLCD